MPVHFYKIFLVHYKLDMAAVPNFEAVFDSFQKITFQFMAHR